MQTILLLEAAAIGIILLTLSRRLLVVLAKWYIFYGYLLLFPLVGPFIPSLNVGPIALSPSRLFLLIGAVLLVLIVIKAPGLFRFSRTMAWLLALNAFLVLNTWLRIAPVPNEVVRFFLPMFLLLLMENLEYDEADRRRLRRVVAVLAVVIAVVSFLQLTWNHNLYQGYNREAHLARDFRIAGEAYRNASIFKDWGLYQGGLAITYLAIYFLFLNFASLRLRDLAMLGLLSFAVFLTFTRVFWLLLLFAAMHFFYSRYRGGKKLVVFAVLGLMALGFYLTFATSIQESQIYRHRVVDETYMGRVRSLDIYFRHFWGREMLLGFGQYSLSSGLFEQYGRGTVHNGILDLLFRAGFVGMFLYLGFWYQVYKRGRAVQRSTGNPVFLTYLVTIFLFNMTAGQITVDCYAYLFLLFCLIVQEKTETVAPAPAEAPGGC